MSYIRQSSVKIPSTWILQDVEYYQITNQTRTSEIHSDNNIRSMYSMRNYFSEPPVNSIFAYGAARYSNIVKCKLEFILILVSFERRVKRRKSRVIGVCLASSGLFSSPLSVRSTPNLHRMPVCHLELGRTGMIESDDENGGRAIDACLSLFFSSRNCEQHRHDRNQVA